MGDNHLFHAGTWRLQVWLSGAGLGVSKRFFAPRLWLVRDVHREGAGCAEE